MTHKGTSRSTLPIIPKELNPDACMTKMQVRAFCGGVASTTISYWMKTRNFPQPIDISTQTPLWRVRDVIGWLDAQPKRKSAGGVQ